MTRSLATPLFTVLCSIIAALAVALFAGYQSSLPPWMLEKGLLFSGLLFGGVLGITILVIKIPLLIKDNTIYSLARALVIGALACIPILVLLLFLARGGILGLDKYSMPNSVLITLLVLFFALLVINSLPLRGIVILVINVCVLVYSAVPSMSEPARNSLRDLVTGKSKLYDDSTNLLFSSLHDVEVTDHVIFPMPKVIRGGGLSVIDEKRLLLVTAGGKVRLLLIKNNGFSLVPGFHKTPFNVDAYLESVKDPSKFFRVTDSLVEVTADNMYRLYISYHHWDVKKSCLTLKISEANLDLENFGKSKLNWTERFASSPCIQKKFYNATGGRMALLGEHTLLLTVGETITGWDEEILSSASYGKILALDKKSWQSRIYSHGHRNPQGLLVLDDGTIWSTEHGPHGGDELNIIREGTDYGWPDVTYGTSYGKKNFRNSETPGDHSVGQRPVYAWVPSIGISNLIRVRGTSFPSWRGDFIVSSLVGQYYGKSLFRVKVAEERVVVVEKIRTGRPIRDLVELVDGRLALWDGHNIIQLVKPATVVFSACSGCHAMRKETHGIGPDLMRIVGKDVARWTGFQYSTAMKKYGGKWTRRRLDEFLENPAAMVPGTTMNFPGIPDPAKRKKVIDYLERLQLPNDN